MTANEYYTTMGLLLGYPECCIEDFISRDISPIKPRPFYGTGFVPCEKCCRVPKEDMLKIIAKNRHPEFPPFPGSPKNLKDMVLSGEFHPFSSLQKSG